MAFFARRSALQSLWSRSEHMDSGTRSVARVTCVVFVARKVHGKKCRAIVTRAAHEWGSRDDCGV